jgi:hypothetical protein
MNLNTPLWKRGARGDFISIILKSPFIPFSKGIKIPEGVTFFLYDDPVSFGEGVGWDIRFLSPKIIDIFYGYDNLYGRIYLSYPFSIKSNNLPPLEKRARRI